VVLPSGHCTDRIVTAQLYYIGSRSGLFSLNNKDVNMLKTKQHVSAKTHRHLLEEPKEVYASFINCRNICQYQHHCIVQFFDQPVYFV
jgi:Mg2+/Co2+ transporter CorB